VNPGANPFAQARFLKSAADRAHWPAADCPEVAFAGRSNAGKSSALNRICGQKNLARVSKTPGRTQLINFFDVDAPVRCRLVDLPGYGFAHVPQDVRRGWGGMIESYLHERDCLRGIVLIMDIRHPLTDFDRQMLHWAEGAPVHVLLSKSDKLSSGQGRAVLQDVRRELERLPGPAGVQLFSAHDQTGAEQARARLLEWVGSSAAAPSPGA